MALGAFTQARCFPGAYRISEAGPPEGPQVYVVFKGGFCQMPPECCYSLDTIVLLVTCQQC